MRPCSAYTFQRVAPGLPRFVLMMITPVEAAVPYSAAADGPLTTSIDSISSGLMSLIRLGFVPPIPMLDELLALVMRTPSMMYRGSLLRDRLLLPRIRTHAPPPGKLPARTSTLGALAF